ncbi:MAG: ATP-binding protein [Anaerolineales bacterium]|nr:MAG: ATP-binding protein [Anaerolineales bacterium]
MSKRRRPKKKSNSNGLSSIVALTPKALRRECDPALLGFATTDELPRLEEVIGQPRAFRALSLGTEVAGPGFNVFVMGLPGSGKTTLVREYLERKAFDEPVPQDWCYVNNFSNPHEPIALGLPASSGPELHKDLGNLITRSREEIIRAFESEAYSQERRQLNEEREKYAEQELAKMTLLAEKYSFTLGQLPFGFVLVPTVEGEPLTPEDLDKLKPEQREKVGKLESKLQDELKSSLGRVRAKAREIQDLIEDLDSRTALYAVEHLVEDLKEKHKALEPILEYLNAVKTDIVANVDLLRKEEERLKGVTGGRTEAEVLRRYDVNVIVDNTDRSCAPVVVEGNPTYHNLLGRIEHEIVMGATRTHFTMIRRGALHRANGGYLILPARDLLLSPYAWEGLKRSLREETIRIESLSAYAGFMGAVSLDPQPIPLNVKVVLVGTPSLYYLLSAHDEDFAKLFKVRSEFASVMDRTPDTEHEYALFVKAVIDDNQLLPFNSASVAKIVEFGSRLSGEQDKISARFGKVADLIRESAYWASKAEKDVVDGEDVIQAIDEVVYRNNLLEERLGEMMREDTLLIDVVGEAVGQANALSVLDLGDYAFGRPSRVTATVYPGRDGVVDIERESELGGRIHTKGVLIIGGFLGGRYGRTNPLNLSAALTFEQSYGDIEGDSASAAELFVLLSALAEIPLRQDLAISGSINQHGQVQAVGGINEKIEGFYKACELKGMTDTQGVIIPKANVQNLMLNDDVTRAVEEGKFHIYSIEVIDEGLSLLSGIEPGIPDEAGLYLEGTFNRAVTDKLAVFAEAIRQQRGLPHDVVERISRE